MASAAVQSEVARVHPRPSTANAVRHATASPRVVQWPQPSPFPSIRPTSGTFGGSLSKTLPARVEQLEQLEQLDQTIATKTTTTFLSYARPVTSRCASNTARKVKLTQGGQVVFDVHPRLHTPRSSDKRVEEHSISLPGSPTADEASLASALRDAAHVSPYTNSNDARPGTAPTGETTKRIAFTQWAHTARHGAKAESVAKALHDEVTRLSVENDILRRRVTPGSILNHNYALASVETKLTAPGTSKPALVGNAGDTAQLTLVRLARPHTASLVERSSFSTTSGESEDPASSSKRGREGVDNGPTSSSRVIFSETPPLLLLLQRQMRLRDAITEHVVETARQQMTHALENQEDASKQAMRKILAAEAAEKAKRRRARLQSKSSSKPASQGKDFNNSGALTTANDLNAIEKTTREILGDQLCPDDLETAAILGEGAIYINRPGGPKLGQIVRTAPDIQIPVRAECDSSDAQTISTPLVLGEAAISQLIAQDPDPLRALTIRQLARAEAQLRTTGEALLERVSELHTKNAETEANLERAKRAADAARECAEDWKRATMAAENDVKHLRDRMEACEKEKSQLTQELAELRVAFQKREGQLRRTQAILDDLERTSGDTEKRLRSELMELENKHRVVELEHARMAEELKALRGAHAENGELRHTVLQLQAQLAASKHDDDVEAQQRASLEAANLRLSEARDALLRNLAIEAERSREQKAMAEDLKQRLETAVAERDLLNQELEKLRQLHQEERQKLEADLKARCSEVEKVALERSKLASDLDKARMEVDKTKALLAHERAAANNVKEVLSAEIRQLNQKIQTIRENEANSARDRATHQSKTLEAELRRSDLEAEVTSLKQQVAQTQDLLGKSRQETAQLKRQTQQAQAQITELQEELFKASAVAESRNKELREIKSKNQILERDLTNTKKQLQQAIAQGMQDAKDLAALRAVAAQNENLLRRIEALEAQLRNEIETSQMYQQRCSDLINERLSLKNEIGTFKLRYQAQVQIRDALQSKLKELASRLGIPSAAIELAINAAAAATEDPSGAAESVRLFSAIGVQTLAASTPVNPSTSPPLQAASSVSTQSISISSSSSVNPAMSPTSLPPNATSAHTMSNASPHDAGDSGSFAQTANAGPPTPLAITPVASEAGTAAGKPAPTRIEAPQPSREPARLPSRPGSSLGQVPNATTTQAVSPMHAPRQAEPPAQTRPKSFAGLYLNVTESTANPLASPRRTPLETSSSSVLAFPFTPSNQPVSFEFPTADFPTPGSNPPRTPAESTRGFFMRRRNNSNASMQDGGF